MKWKAKYKKAILIYDIFCFGSISKSSVSIHERKSSKRKLLHISCIFFSLESFFSNYCNPKSTQNHYVIIHSLIYFLFEKETKKNRKLFKMFGLKITFIFLAIFKK